MTYHDSVKADYESYVSTDCGQRGLVLQFSLVNKCAWDSQEDKALIPRSLVVTQKKRIVCSSCEIAIVFKKWVAFVGSSIPQGLSFYDGSWCMDSGEEHRSEGEIICKLEGDNLCCRHRIPFACRWPIQKDISAFQEGRLFGGHSTRLQVVKVAVINGFGASDECLA